MRNDVESLIGEAKEIRDGLFEKQIQIDWQKSKFLRLPHCFRLDKSLSRFCEFYDIIVEVGPVTEKLFTIRNFLSWRVWHNHGHPHLLNTME